MRILTEAVFVQGFNALKEMLDESLEKLLGNSSGEISIMTVENLLYSLKSDAEMIAEQNIQSLLDVFTCKFDTLAQQLQSKFVAQNDFLEKILPFVQKSRKTIKVPTFKLFLETLIVRFVAFVTIMLLLL